MSDERTPGDVSYQKLSISKLKSLLSARGVALPHVKDQPKEYYIRLYETYVLKVGSSENDDDVVQGSDQSDSGSYSDEDAAAEPLTQYTKQHPSVTTTERTAFLSTTNGNNKSTTVQGSRCTSWRLVACLIALALAVLVSAGMTCSAMQDSSTSPSYNTAHYNAWCSSVQRVLRGLSLGIYSYQSGAADY
jgi:hypothetical protein